jgi:hypothetical protein
MLLGLGLVAAGVHLSDAALLVASAGILLPSGYAQLTTTLQTLRQELDLKCCLVTTSRELAAPSS